MCLDHSYIKRYAQSRFSWWPILIFSHKLLSEPLILPIFVSLTCQVLSNLNYTVTLLLNPLMKKPWYTELMTFLIALAMGTMFCVTIYQLIPEALELLHTSEYTVACELRHRDCHFTCGICHKNGVNFNRTSLDELDCSLGHWLSKKLYVKLMKKWQRRKNIKSLIEGSNTALCKSYHYW